jgi:hypothetical protein
LWPVQFPVNSSRHAVRRVALRAAFGSALRPSWPPSQESRSARTFGRYYWKDLFFSLFKILAILSNPDNHGRVYAMKNVSCYLHSRKTRYRWVANPYRIKTSALSVPGCRLHIENGHSIKRRQALLDVPTCALLCCFATTINLPKLSLQNGIIALL